MGTLRMGTLRRGGRGTSEFRVMCRFGVLCRMAQRSRRMCRSSPVKTSSIFNGNVLNPQRQSHIFPAVCPQKVEPLTITIGAKQISKSNARQWRLGAKLGAQLVWLRLVTLPQSSQPVGNDTRADR